MSNFKNIAVLTLGCPKNVVDSEKLIGALSANGFNVVKSLDETDTCIINTCGFIKPAVEENLKVLLEVVNLKIQGKLQKVIVAGCLVERFKESLRREFSEIDLFVGVESLEQIIKYLKLDSQLKSQLLGERQLLTPKHYGYLKISEGCNRECAFCVIPNIRGRLRSTPIPKLVEEAKLLASKGVRELIIVSQDTSSYGIDIYREPKLLHLLKELVAIPDISWIRVMYLYPAGIPKGLIDFVAKEPKMCKYFDIPIQHISDNVLKSMRRGSSKRNLIQIIENIRTKVPDAVIRTTLIVGYPTETEKDFEELIQFLKEYELERVGVFTYSREDGSYAFELGDPISEEIKNYRLQEILKVQSRISLKKNKQMIGKGFKVLIDDKTDGVYLCRTEFDAPEVDNLVYLKTSKNVSVGDFVNVEIVKAKPYDLLAKLK